MILYGPGILDFIWHHRQPPRYGCLASSFYACTGDQRFLAHIEEVQTWRLLAIAHGYGYVQLPAFHGMSTLQMTPELWAKHETYLQSGQMNRYVADVPSLTMPGVHHSVVIAVGNNNGMFEYFVSDSQRDDIIEFESRDEFLESPYAAAFELGMLALADQALEWFKFVDPLEQLAKSYPAAYAASAGDA